MSEEPKGKKTDVGAIVRQKRLLRGQSLETVHQHTRIPKRLLEALENNKPEAFSAPVYLRGFLKSYCEYLELDFEPLWRELSERGGREDPAQPRRERREAKKPSGSMMLPFTDSTLLPFLLVLALLLAGSALWFLRGRGEPPARPQPAALSAAIAPLASRNDIVLRLIPLRDTWIRLSVDGNLRFEGRLPREAQLPEYRAKRYSLRAASPADLQVLVDGTSTQLTLYPRDAEGDFLISR